MSTPCGGTTAAAAAGAACNTWKRLLSLASLWAVCEFVAVKVFFDTDLSSVGRGSLLADAVGGGGNDNGRGRGKRGRFRRRRYTDDGPSFEAPHMQKKAATKKYQQKQQQHQQQKKQHLDDDDDALSSESEDSQQLGGLGSPSDGTSYHIFQIAKPHTGSTLLNCILQGLLDEPFEKYSFLPIVKPTDEGRFGSYPQGVTESSVENEPYPFILHDGRLKTAEDNMGVTAVTKTHIVDVEELEGEFGHLFERVFYVAANRAAKDITIRAEYCELDNVLCFDYDDFAYTPDDSSPEDIAVIVERIKLGLEEKFPLLIDVDMDVDEAVKRVQLMEKATAEMADKSFKQHEPYFGIHGGHRNRDDNNNQQQKEKKGNGGGVRRQNPASPQQKLSLVHIAPTYKVKKCDAQFCPYDQDQSVAIASMQRAREQSKKASVTLAASVFTEDGDVVPADFVRLDDLSRSTMSDYPNLPLKKKLPFINDIFDNLRTSSGFNAYDYVIYTNADIIVAEKFYDVVTTAIDSGYDAFTINRQTVPKRKTNKQLYTALDLDDIYQLKGKTHPGSDCFVMKRSIFEKINMGNLFLGYPPTANVLLVQAESLADRYTMFASNELKATFHLGDDKSWHQKNDANLEYEVTNYENAYNDLHEVWTALCEFRPEYDSRRLNSLKYVGNNMSCSRLAIKFYSVAGYDLAKEQQDAASGNKMALAPPALAVTGTSSQVVKTDSPIVFQFLVGLEGTGHHLHQKLYKGSPAHKRLKSYGLLDDVSDLLKSLWNRESPSDGLWSATCAMSNEEKLWWKQENEGTDGEKLFNNLVSHLKSLDEKSRSKVEADDAMQPEDDLVIAVNSGSIYNQEAAPFLSYPLLHGPCRFLQYPILDIFYEACNAAGVRCQHALSFRDPYRVLKSTSMNRHFASRHVQLQTLHSMLNVIQGQMLSHSDRLVACWESDMGAKGGANDLARLFGWKNDAKFDGWYSKIFLEPSPLSEEDKSEITMEKQLEVYMNSMIKDMANIKATCRSQLLFNSQSTPQSFKPPKAAPALLPPQPVQTASKSNFASRAALLSEGGDVDELVPPRPDWLDNYIEYHRSSVEPDGNGGYRLKDDVPFVVYECSDNEKCGGIGDRINSMVLVLYLAMCSGRVLLINAPYPSPLENFLNPNEVQWDATPPDLGEKLQTLDIMDIRNHDLIVDQSIIGYRLGRCNGMPPRHTLKTIWKNQCMSGYFQRIDQIFPFPAELPEEKLLRWSFWSLFKFSDAVLLRAEELKTSAKLPSDTNGHVSPYLGIHLRTGDRSMDIDNMGLKGPRSRYKARQQREYLDCYRRFQQALPDTQIGYVASDSASAKEKLNRWESSIHFSDETDIFHVDESLRVAASEALAGDDRSYQGSLDGWAELAVMVDAECIIMSWSMFSFTAHYIGGENRCGVYVGHCQEENVGNIPHEYSYETGRNPFTMIQ